MGGRVDFVGEALIGEPVGILETEGGWRVMPRSNWATSTRSGAGSARDRCAERPAGRGI